MNYWDYIRVEELLSLQSGKEGDERPLSNHETLFVVVHQVYELWFKVVLKELTLVRDRLSQNPVPDKELASLVRSLRRITTIFEQAVSHFRVMETLSTRDYLEFRDHLFPASGFQSAQLREIEIILGLDDERRIPLGTEGSYKEALKYPDGRSSPASRRVEERLSSGASVRQVLYEWLSRTPIDGSSTQASADAFLERFLESHRKEAALSIERFKERGISERELTILTQRYEKEHAFSERFFRGLDDPENAPFRRRVRAAMLFLESYQELPRLASAREVIESVLVLEQGMIMWRQRHARMVERIIGRRIGTGGSSGVDYLDQTALRYRVFDDLWTVRTFLLKRSSLPGLEHADDYRFRIED